LTRTIDFVVPGSLSWRLPLGLQIAPGVLLALGAIFLLPASPRLLVLKGRYAEAETSLVKLRGRDDGLTKVKPSSHAPYPYFNVST
jgi:hypothetical protein